MKVKNRILQINSLSSAKRVVLNTLIVYAQRFFAAILSLITTPIILKQLGVEDYGLYTLTVGLVGMLAFINWSLSSATQRYIAVALGENEFQKLKSIFTSALFIHIIYAVILLILIGTIGFIFLDSILKIPEGRTIDAKIILLIVALISFFNIISVPFTGVLRAHENFLIIALIGILESVFKLAIALVLIYFNSDKLILYSLLLLSVSIILFGLNVLLSNKTYAEINFNFKNFNSSLVKEMLGFIGWNIFGSIAIVSRNQGVSILLNMFFGVVRNAAYGIAMQVNSALSILSQGIVGSISPQLMKSAGKKDHNKMIYLMRTMSKMAVLSVSIFSIPLLFETSVIMKLWLKEVPPDTIIYTRLIIIYGLLMLLSAGIHTTFNAIGKIKLYNIWVSTILILNLPISYLLFKSGFASQSILFVGIGLEIISFITRHLLLNKYINLSLTSIFIDLIFRIIVPMCILSAFLFIVRQLQINEHLRLILSFSVSIVIYPFIIFFVGLDKKQQDIVKDIYFSTKQKFLFK